MTNDPLEIAWPSGSRAHFLLSEDQTDGCAGDEMHGIPSDGRPAAVLELATKVSSWIHKLGNSNLDELSAAKTELALRMNQRNDAITAVRAKSEEDLFLQRFNLCVLNRRFHGLSTWRASHLRHLERMDPERTGEQQIEADLEEVAGRIDTLRRQEHALRTENDELDMAIHTAKVSWEEDRRASLDTVSRITSSFTELVQEIDQLWKQLESRGPTGSVSSAHC